MKKLSTLIGAAFAALVLFSARADIDLNGDWEMSYRPYVWERNVFQPEFTGRVVRNAVPGYWEDMREAFREAGITDEFRINPWYERQTLPIRGAAQDTTLPDIYGTFYYRRTFELDAVKDRAFLEFGGVRNQVGAWINGLYVGFHQGFSVPFRFALPGDVLRPGRNEIVLAVSNNPNRGYNGADVCGLTTRGLFRSTGGVNGDVVLRFHASDLTEPYVTTAADLKTVTVHVPGAKEEFEYEIRDGDRVLESGRAKGDITLSAEGFERWSPERPKRYGLVVRCRGDEFRQLFGVRRLAADGCRLRLNGKFTYLRGVTEHCYFANTVHLPRDPEYYRMITAKRKELGFNFVRFHTFIPPAEYLDACDELGMLVHLETPNFVPEAEFAAIVAFARRHPSVVIYCTGNETRIDRLAETYLRYVADIVHRDSDALFSPMSALRGVEYALMPGKDPVVSAPFAHNAERAGRLAEYCDLFTSYQLSVASYGHVDNGTSATLDAWSAAYLDRPRVSHEICIDTTYVDFGLEERYPAGSPVVKTGLFSELRRVLGEKGVLDRADRYYRNSCEFLWRIRKFCFEKLRAASKVQGYDYLGDINTHWHTFGYDVGMMDEFYTLKPGETAENALRYNSAAVLLADFGTDFNVRAGETRKVGFSLSNYDADSPAAPLEVALKDETGRTAFAKTVATPAVACGEVAALASVPVEVPTAGKPVKYWLEAARGGTANRWELYAFPEEDVPAALAEARTKGVKVVDAISKEALLDAMAKGEKVVLFGAGPFKSLPAGFNDGRPGRCSGDFATDIMKGHPALGDFPHDGFCSWQFRRLRQGCRDVQLEAGVPFAPIIDVASSPKRPIRQSVLFEYRVGEGRLLCCSLNFREKDPAAVCLKRALLAYAASERFAPPQSLTPAELAAVIDAPLLTGAADTNRARNDNDPSSPVRAGALAMP